jgi:hypothetical protein
MSQDSSQQKAAFGMKELSSVNMFCRVLSEKDESS